MSEWEVSEEHRSALAAAIMGWRKWHGQMEEESDGNMHTATCDLWKPLWEPHCTCGWADLASGLQVLAEDRIL